MVKFACLKDPTSCAGWDFCPWQVLPCRPDWLKGRGLTKSSPWSSRLGVGRWVNNPLLEKKNKIISETETSLATAPYCGAAGVQDVNARLERNAKQRMTLKPPMQLLSPKVRVRIGQWNVRTMFETGTCAQVTKEMRRYGISILGVSEMGWSSCWKLMMANGEAELYSGMDEGENHDRGVGLILSRDAAKRLLEWKPVSERIIRATFNSR